MLLDSQCAVACGGATILPGDVVVGDEEGVVAIPAAFAKSVVEGGVAQDHVEGWANRRLAKDDEMPGLYPPNEKAMKDYEKWVKAGEPDEVQGGGDFAVPS